MKIAEDELIERIRRRVPSSVGRGLEQGIGDDAAVLRHQGNDWVLSCDQFLENVHFLMDVHPPDAIGYKALARATSDIAAMGARPRFFLMSLALPAQRTGHWLDAMLAGMARAARHFGLKLAGGDTARSAGRNGAAALNIMVLGEVQPGRAIGRAGARPGDVIFVSGHLGRAQLGLEVLLHRMQRRPRFRPLLRPHLYPALAVDLGMWLSRKRLASAMMDLSDGLSTDLERLCRASGAGARIYERNIPAVAVPRALQNRGIDALSLALHGGEDYVLLFTVPERFASGVPHAFRGTAINRIGEIVGGRKVDLVSADGRVSRLVPGGWDHFRGSFGPSGRGRKGA
jgi:thiamine-monophosphate kinase